jgi:O-antigen/teichoic acid export membrane protein
VLHTRRKNVVICAQTDARLTVTETSFRNAKSHTARLVGYKAAADFAGKSVVFVITVVAARRLSPEAFGVFSLATTLGWMLALASDFGIQFHVARIVARQPTRAADALTTWLRVRVWTAAAAVGTVAAGLVVARASAAVAVPIVLFALVYAGSGLLEFLHYFYRGLSRSEVESTLILGQRTSTLVLAVAALVWWPSVAVLAVAMLVPIAGTLAVSLRVARRITPASGTTNPDSANPDSANPESRIPNPESFWRDVFPIGAGIVLSALYFRIDVFLVDWWWGTEAVARYNAVFRLVEALRLFPAAVLAVMLPDLVRARDRRLVRRIAVGVTAFACLVAAVAWLTADVVVTLLYGRAYSTAIPAFRILALTFPLLSLNYALTHQLVAWSGQRTYAVLCGLALAVNVALNVTLLPSLSIDGAAWSTVGTELFLTLGCAWALATRHAAASEVAAAGIAA